MKEDHIVAGILMMLIAALIFGALSQADDNGLTASAALLPFTNSNAGSIFLIAIIAIALLAGFFGLYELYFKGALGRRKQKKFTPTKSTSVGVSLSSIGMLAEPKDPQVERIKGYIHIQRAKGQKDTDIRAKLKSVGWAQDSVDKAFK